MLKSTGLSDKSGLLLNSGSETLKKGDFYFLGLNPGGSPDGITGKDKIQNHLFKEQQDFNEYLEGIWSPGGKTKLPGQAVLQKRFQYLFSSLGVDPRNVCGSNLIFVRSRRANDLKEQKTLANKCWVVHEYIISLVKPKAIFVLGESPFTFVKNKIQKIKTDSCMAGHANWKCDLFKGMLLNEEVLLFKIPHLSIYAIDKHPEVIEWIKQHLKLS